ncbi:hypothetical protein CYMTET_26255 [Cymbomonas tetramitiformis]|uniref:Uncharacterized protein n=1 Tax=Cymbomonas tetramitiformis TaxID=36881 RepID=A0AAE0KY30_9CHLO|nr:hypothetical protein CYMTET_26255 [Cymbomonas tetramitiformis]|eukprot:gene18918-22603_t
MAAVEFNLVDGQLELISPGSGGLSKPTQVWSLEDDLRLLSKQLKKGDFQAEQKSIRDNDLAKESEQQDMDAADRILSSAQEGCQRQDGEPTCMEDLLFKAGREDRKYASEEVESRQEDLRSLVSDMGSSKWFLEAEKACCGDLHALLSDPCTEELLPSSAQSQGVQEEVDTPSTLLEFKPKDEEEQFLVNDVKLLINQINSSGWFEKAVAVGSPGTDEKQPVFLEMDEEEIDESVLENLRRQMGSMQASAPFTHSDSPGADLGAFAVCEEMDQEVVKDLEQMMKINCNSQDQVAVKGKVCETNIDFAVGEELDQAVVEDLQVMLGTKS